MATWNAPLPDEAKVGDSGHAADHNELVAAHVEERVAIDAAEKTAVWGSVTGKPSTFPPTIGTTATTAKAGNYSPSTAEVANALKSKSQISALTAVAEDADAAALATAVNAIVAALKA